MNTMMMLAFVWLVGVSSGFAGGGPSGEAPPVGTASCTADSPTTRGVVTDFVQAESGPGGLFEGADPASLVVVTNGGVCSSLRKEFDDIYDVQGGNASYVATYYELQDRYIVHIVPREVVEPDPAPPGKVTIVEMPSKILVYDTAFNEIGSFLIGA